MKAIVGLIFVFFTVSLYAQETIRAEDLAPGNDISGFKGGGVWIKNTAVSPTDVKGSQYLFYYWSNAAIYVDQKVYKMDAFNFNVENQRFEAKFSEDSVLIMNTSNIKKIVIGDKTFSRFELEGSANNPFVEVIGRFDNSILFKKYELVIKEGSFNPMTQKMTRPPEYVINEHYFTVNLDGSNVEKTKLKKSAILKLFDKNSQEKVEAFANENRLDFNDEQDVHQIFEYSNTL